jgi:type II secretory pathway component PulF
MNARVEDKSAGNERQGDVLTWLATILACTYIVWTGTALYFSTPIFINMYGSMGVDLQLSTKILIGFYRLMYPILFGGIAALVITKQFFVRDKWMSVSVTLAAIVAVSLISEGIVRALYRPLFDMAEQLSK